MNRARRRPRDDAGAFRPPQSRPAALARLLLLPLVILLGLAFARFPLPASLALCGGATLAHAALGWGRRGPLLAALERSVRFALFCTAPTAVSLVYAINGGLPGAEVPHGLAGLATALPLPIPLPGHGEWLHLALSWCLPAFFMGCGLARSWLARPCARAGAPRVLGVGGGGMVSWSLCYTTAAFGMWFVE